MRVRHSARFLSVSAVILASSLTGALRGATADFLGAPIAKSTIRLHLDDPKTIRWTIPERGGAAQDLTANKTFVTPRTVTVTVLKLNPLRHRVKATSKSVPDPGAATMSNLVATFLNLASVIAPTSPGLDDTRAEASVASLTDDRHSSDDPCAGLDSDLTTLYANLESPKFSPNGVGKAVSDWSEKIDETFRTANGPASIGAGITAVNASIDGWRGAITQAEASIVKLRRCAESPIEEPDPVPEAPDPGPQPAALELPPKPETNATASQRDQFWDELKKYEARSKAREQWPQQDEAWRKYNKYLSDVAAANDHNGRRRVAITVIAGVQRRVEELKALVAKASEIAKQLAEFAKLGAWTVTEAGDSTSDFILLRGISPTFAEMEEVTIEVTPLSFPVDSETGLFSVAEAKPIGGTLTVRRFSRFAIEPAVGAVFATVTQPQYGTGTNDDEKTVVKRVDDKKISFSPSVMANFVCRCGTSMISPMIQLGAAASKDTPGVLVGAGLRLFGSKTGLGIGGGAMFSWVKDLQTLQENQVVTGTAEIEADLAYRLRPSVGGYFTIQYQF